MSPRERAIEHYKIATASEPLEALTDNEQINAQLYCKCGGGLIARIISPENFVRIRCPRCGWSGAELSLAADSVPDWMLVGRSWK